MKHIFGKDNEGDQIKKNIGHISGKVIEGDEKKTFDLFKKKLTRAKKNNIFYLAKCTGFFRNVFLSQKLTVFFPKSATI